MCRALLQAKLERVCNEKSIRNYCLKNFRLAVLLLPQVKSSYPSVFRFRSKQAVAIMKLRMAKFSGLNSFQYENMLLDSKFVLLICASLLFSTRFLNGQILRHEIPAELQYLMDSNLYAWNPPEEIRLNYPYYLSGFDEENRPIWVLEMGKWDIRAALEKGEKSEKDLDMHVDQATWHFLNSTGMRATLEEPVKEFIVIIDAEGYGLRQLNSPKTVHFMVKKLSLLTIATRFADQVYTVNANYVAERLLSILKPVLGKEFEKFQIFGTNPNQWIPKILKKIPRSQLPKWYGGIENFTPVQVYG